jgi:two-component system, chemotaxis family, chemotaxis protein CheY
MKFLVIDESATMQRIAINSLQRVGDSGVVEAEAGAQTLELFGRRLASC